MKAKILLNLSASNNKQPEILVTSAETGLSQLISGCTSKYELALDLPVGPHLITFKLLNKEGTDTVVDSAGCVVSDLNCVIESIAIGLTTLVDINSVTVSANKTNGWIVNGDEYTILVIAPGSYFQTRRILYSNNPKLLHHAL